MNTDDLIKKLNEDLKPVKRESSPNHFAIKYLSVLLVIILVGILILTLRADLKTQAENFFFILDTLFNVLILMSGLFLVGWFSSAGRKYSRYLKYLMLILFVIVLILNAYRLSLTDIFFQKFVIQAFDINCFSLVLLFSVVSMAVVGIGVSKRIVMKPGLTGFTIGLLSFSVGSFVLNLHCPIAADEHIVIYHTLLPMSMGAFIGFVLGRKFLRF